MSINRRKLLGTLLGTGAMGFAQPAISLNGAAKPSSNPEPWLTLPDTPELPSGGNHAVVDLNGTPIFFSQFGKGPNVLMLHGGLANSNYWAHQVRELAQSFLVTVMDTRGHGRSAVTSDLFSYTQFAHDVVALLKDLGISKSAIVGWSDGAITGIELALARPDLVSGLFAFGANTNLGGLKAGGAQTGTFKLFSERCRREYLSLSPHPERWPRLHSALVAMWRSQPNLEWKRLSAIEIPVLIAAGEHDEIIKLDHARKISTEIPHAQLVILKTLSHFAFLQDPSQFNAPLLQFLFKTLS
jgi:pimeloyl-ACP methyl ester carboxylesterase